MIFMVEVVDRINLCSATEVGGLSPTLHTFAWMVSAEPHVGSRFDVHLVMSHVLTSTTSHGPFKVTALARIPQCLPLLFGGDDQLSVWV